ncbi:MAG: hypothetical protein J5755_02815, partial [Clostridia bacterium]|nr:hypothetical protein [Clostridia bacterium]
MDKNDFWTTITPEYLADKGRGLRTLAKQAGLTDYAFDSDDVLIAKLLRRKEELFPAAKEEPTPEPEEEILRPQERADKGDAFGESLAGCELREGTLEILPDGYGFLRASMRNSLKDAYVSSPRIKRYNLRMGDHIVAYTKQTAEGKPPAVVSVVSVNGHSDWEEFQKRPSFEAFTPIYPEERLQMEIKGKRNELALRCIDILAPIGKGQRAM